MKTFTEERQCTECNSKTCPAKSVQFGMTETTSLLSRYACFVKAYLLNKVSVEEAKQILDNPLSQYIGIKTQAVTRTTTRRGSYANLGTLLVILNDYLIHLENYEKYDGMKFSDYLVQVRELPGCAKIQNHAINDRLNQEFEKFFRDEEAPIIRVPVPSSLGATTYKLNVSLLRLGKAKTQPRAFAGYLLDILRLYFRLREVGNEEVIVYCRWLQTDPKANEEATSVFFRDSVRHDDARMFQITAFAILKAWYSTRYVILGESKEKLETVPLSLYRTGRVNANDGGIDYILTPLGKYFQATQNFNFEKYFLDIDKLARYPLSFVIQTDMTPDQAFKRIRKDAEKKYTDPVILESYLNSFEAVLTLVSLDEKLNEIRSLPTAVKTQLFKEMIAEFIRQFKVEYNIK